MELKMNKEIFGEYTLTNEEKESLRKEIIELLQEYDYRPTEYAVNKILDEWVKNKGWMIELFKKHPNYNGKFQIVFDSDYQRNCDKDTLYNFGNYLENIAANVLEEVQIGVFSYKEVYLAYEKLNRIYNLAKDIYYERSFAVKVNDLSLKEIANEKKRWHEKLVQYQNAIYLDNHMLSSNRVYTRKTWKLYDSLLSIADKIKFFKDNLASEQFANDVNYYLPEIKAVAGQKVSRIVGKIAKLSGIDKHPEWNREFAKYSDAINPLTIKRHTILSCHPIDYFTMSFGNSWASCHTIDKQNKREMPNDYSGCYSSGTLSYMLDGSSFVYYTVDKDYNGSKLELQDKINRNMFHMGEDKLIQARVYPQTTDGETGIYRQIREIAQKVISDCLGVPNMWVNRKGASECKSVIDSYGTHYRDYLHFSDCNVSYLKGNNDILNTNVINVGHDPICPNCGDYHSTEECIECEGCYEDEIECADCGSYHSRSEMREIDGEWYCDDCCFYCDYHDEYEHGSYTYVENYGRVCDSGLDWGDFFCCEHCGEYRHRDDMILTVDDTWFCCDSCAERDGYMELDGEWYPESEIHTCEHCGQLVHINDWDYDYDCCNDCVEEIRAEIEAEVEEREAI